MTNAHNIKLNRDGRKRRAKLLRQYNAGKTPTELAAIEGISPSRMRWMLAKAREEVRYG